MLEAEVLKQLLCCT